MGELDAEPAGADGAAGADGRASVIDGASRRLVWTAGAAARGDATGAGVAAVVRWMPGSASGTPLSAVSCGLTQTAPVATGISGVEDGPALVVAWLSPVAGVPVDVVAGRSGRAPTRGRELGAAGDAGAGDGVARWTGTAALRVAVVVPDPDVASGSVPDPPPDGAPGAGGPAAGRSAWS